MTVSLCQCIINKIVELGDSPRFIVALCETIQSLCQPHISSATFLIVAATSYQMEESFFDKVDFNGVITYCGCGAAGTKSVVCSVLRIGIPIIILTPLKMDMVSTLILSNMAQKSSDDD